MKKRYLFLTLVILIFAWSYFDYFRYQNMIKAGSGKYYAIDPEGICHVNYDYQCPDGVCNPKEEQFGYYNAYFTNLFDAVKYAENNYQKFYYNIPKELIKKYDLYKVFLINTICEHDNSDFNEIYGYGVLFSGDYLHEFYKNEKKYSITEVYTFEEVYNNLKKLKEENK